MDQNISFESIRRTILLQGAPYLIRVNLLDEYQGTLIPHMCRSLCVELVFQSNKKTLISKEVNDLIQNIESILIKIFDAKIRV